MVIDASALVAVLTGEPEQRPYIEAIEAADARLISAATFVETSIVIDARLGPEGIRDLDRFVDRAELELVPVDTEQAYVARDAFARFGKGRHRARLKYGDCFTYALASVANEPVLCKGEDFARTDIEVVR